MPIVQPIDGAMLIQALRTGQQDRMSFERARAEQEQMRIDNERKQKVSGLMGQLFGSPQGLAAQAVPQMGTPQAGAPQAAPPQMAPQQGPPPRTPNPQVMAQLIALEPEIGGKIASAFKTMSDTDIARSEQKNSIMAAAARTLASVPENERGQFLQTIAPQLMQVGWTQQEIAQANLTDQGLRMLEATSIDLDNLIDNELAEREFQAGKVVSTQPGGWSLRVRPNAPVEVLAGPSGMSGGSDIPAEAIAALKNGEGTPEQFDEMFGPGAAASVMGGTAGNGGGGF